MTFEEYDEQVNVLLDEANELAGEAEFAKAAEKMRQIIVLARSVEHTCLESFKSVQEMAERACVVGKKLLDAQHKSDLALLHAKPYTAAIN